MIIRLVLEVGSDGNCFFFNMNYMLVEFSIIVVFGSNVCMLLLMYIDCYSVCVCVR